MRIALVHDYLNEFGGAEKVLQMLTEMFPEAPIYTAFYVPDSTAAKAFAGRKIITSWFQYLPWHEHLYSPLRFLIPWIWGGLDFSGYDLIITSASWYITKGLGKKFSVPEICYCHTPPRWLYGYPTSINLQKYWPVRIYALIVGHFLRIYDFNQAQKVDQFVANSQEVANRIRKFYRREAIVIYPPVDMPSVKDVKKDNYYLLLSRLAGGKGIELAVEAAKRGRFKLKIAGEASGYGGVRNVESLGRVSDIEKAQLMASARGFLALEQAPDFGITPVESMLVGTPVIAFNGGGYKESVVDGKSGVLFDDYSSDGLVVAVNRFSKLKWDKQTIQKLAQKFSTERFKKQMLELVEKYARTSRN